MAITIATSARTARAAIAAAVTPLPVSPLPSLAPEILLAIPRDPAEEAMALGEKGGTFFAAKQWGEEGVEG